MGVTEGAELFRRARLEEGAYDDPGVRLDEGAYDDPAKLDIP